MIRGALSSHRLPGPDSEAPNFRASSESSSPVRELARRDLETLRLRREHQGGKFPTKDGMILFGRERERHFRDAWIRAGRFTRNRPRALIQMATGSGKTIAAITAIYRLIRPRVIECEPKNGLAWPPSSR